MKYSEAKRGRTFVIRLEDGDILHDAVESFAASNGIKAAFLQAVGGVKAGSILIVGPEKGDEMPPKPVPLTLDETYEITGTGTLFPDDEGAPILHMHVACGRGGKTITGCVRNGVIVWHVMEIILTELEDSGAQRLTDPETGFKLLVP